jgi:type I restriction enzyme, R subunit
VVTELRHARSGLHGYPPDEEKDAIDKVIQQLETFADEWSPNADQR